MLDQSSVKLWSVGGGKGGVGKSIVTLGLGVCLAESSLTVTWEGPTSTPF